MILISAAADVIHRFINAGIKLIAADVSGLLGESIQRAAQTFCAQTPLIPRGRWKEWSDITLTSSSSPKFRPSKSSIAVRAEAGRSRTQ